MSGHSKWSTIKRQKETTDKKKGLAFSKLTKAISSSAHAGADPGSNFKLRLLIEKARAVNMPKDNIARAITKGSGQDGGSSLEEVVYEGFGPEGIAVIVEAITDNRNRTTAEIKNIFERGGGNLAGPGAVLYQFKKLTNISVEKAGDTEAQLLALMDLGVEDVEESGELIDVYCLLGGTEEVKEKIIQLGFKVSALEMVMKPTVFVPVSDRSKKERVVRFMESLEEDDDVQNVFANFDFQE